MYLRLFLLFGIMSVIGGGYAYHQVKVSNLEADITRLESDNRTLKENQVQLELAVNTATTSLRKAEEHAARQSEAMNVLTVKNQSLQRDKDNAMRIFKDHNLTRLARARPGMIETRANKKTAEVFRELENDTKELMDADDSNADGVQSDATSGVGSRTPTTGTTDSDGNTEGTN